MLLLLLLLPPKAPQLIALLLLLGCVGLVATLLHAQLGVGGIASEKLALTSVQPPGELFFGAAREP
jgi:hypothetical protein